MQLQELEDNKQTKYSSLHMKKLEQLNEKSPIKSHTLLKINYLKIVFLMGIYCLSIIGLIFFKHFVERIIKNLCFSEVENIEEATHIYMIGQQKYEQISIIQQKLYPTNKRFKSSLFYFKNTLFEYFQNDILPIKFDYHAEISNSLSIDIFQQRNSQNMLSQKQIQEDIQEKRSYYGKNEHPVYIENFFWFFFKQMTQPIYLFQIAIFIFMLTQKIYTYGISYFILAIFTIVIHYILNLLNYWKIKDKVDSNYHVKVIRNGKQFQISKCDMVPGDIFQIQEQLKGIPCDAMMLNGTCFVNQSSITGQSRPVKKFQWVRSKNSVQPSENNLIYEGTTLCNFSQNDSNLIIAKAINTGFATYKGEIISNTLVKPHKMSQYQKKFLIFYIFNSIITFILVMAINIAIYFTNRSDNLGLIINSLYFSLRSIRWIPVYIMAGYSFSYLRLKYTDDVQLVELQKILETSKIEKICFDKTGTLTKNQLQIDQIHGKSYVYMPDRQFNLEGKTKIDQIFQESCFIRLFMASCHEIYKEGIQKLKIISNDQAIIKIQGDQIDGQILKQVIQKRPKIQFDQQQFQEIMRHVVEDDDKLTILKMNQFHNSTNSMSVVIKYQNKDGTKYLVFAKGDPQFMINHNLELAQKENQQKKLLIEATITNYSKKGLRIIGFMIKQINEADIQRYIQKTQLQIIESIEFIGLIPFNNNLKEDARKLIQELNQNNIESYVITGDNIFVAIKVAFNVNIIRKDFKILVMEGKNFQNNQFKGQIIRLEKEQFVVKSKISQYVLLDELKEFDKIAIDGEMFQKIKISQNQVLVNFFQTNYDKIAVFARTKAEQKAMIVEDFKKIIKKQYSEKSNIDRWFGPLITKVAMVGDGVNDLLAIKNSNLGISINESPAYYGSSFVIKSLGQIRNIIIQGRNVERQFVQFTITEFINSSQTIAFLIIFRQMHNVFTEKQNIYGRYSIVLAVAFMIILSKPYKRITKDIPFSNLMSFRLLLVYWSLNIIFHLGMIMSIYLFWADSDEYQTDLKSFDEIIQNCRKYCFIQQNQCQENNWFGGKCGNTQTVTIVYLMWNFIYVWFGLAFWRSTPWKQHMWQPSISFFFFIFLIIVGILSVVMFYVSTQFGSFDVMQLKSTTQIHQVILTCIVTIIILAVLCEIYRVTKFDSWSLKEKKDRQVEIKND